MRISKKISLPLAFSLLTAVSAFSQTDVFEQDLSGIHPYAGLKWNSKITQPVLGVEYTIESRASLGIQMGMPLSDTMFSTLKPTDSLSASKLHSYFFNPYAVFELLEPDNNSKLAFSLRADYIFESAPSDSGRNSYRRHSFGIGPVFGYRVHANEKIDVIPQLSYEFFYTKWRRNWLGVRRTDGTYTVGVFDDDYFIQHDIKLSADVLYKLDEVQGLTAEPGIVLKLGDGRRSSDLLNIDLRIGYYRSF